MLNILFFMLGLEVSMFNGNYTLYNENGYCPDVDINDTYSVLMYAQIFITDYVYVKGSAKIPMWKRNEDIYFFPFYLSSFVEAGITVNHFKAGVRHFCTHPVVPYFTEETILKFSDESGTEFFIRFETDKIKLF